MKVRTGSVLRANRATEKREPREQNAVAQENGPFDTEARSTERAESADVRLRSMNRAMDGVTGVKKAFRFEPVGFAKRKKPSNEKLRVCFCAAKNHRSETMD
mmetsp:Transcript_9875/g.20755  ORF Transcript_9875/g.20755 Transcript_9875/m.20755 type:complete len:102 (-) Transcript_9875:555-860(-)